MPKKRRHIGTLCKTTLWYIVHRDMLFEGEVNLLGIGRPLRKWISCKLAGATPLQYSAVMVPSKTGNVHDVHNFDNWKTLVSRYSIREEHRAISTFSRGQSSTSYSHHACSIGTANKR